ncbi:I-BasI [Bacillus phage Hoody T]|uniref:I-BasI n=1 Tax=Bacillus phage Hoody T TaxID=1486660 RepID=A0A024B240_9CAUD|nr:I-BasI [Bacillus phage Hoody T]AHZ10467.1 I-BasI [Bacillus phage Hoody T]
MWCYWRYIMFQEEWKDVTGFEDYYEVSNKGRVASKRTGVIMAQYKINSGYLCIKFTVNKKRTSHLVHRLVAREFCEGYSPELDVNHKDTDRMNNNYDNLEWLTRADNLKDVRERGKLNTHTAREALAKVSKKAVDVYTKDGSEYITTYPSATEAAKALGVQGAKISTVCHGKRQHTGGYHFKFNSSVDPNRSVSKK